MKILQLLLIGFYFSSCVSAQQSIVNFETKPYFFDVGASVSKVSESSILLTPEFKYSSELGYGWTTTDLKNFYHEQTEQSRDEFLVDGIQGSEIGFKADIPEGVWQMVLWFEFGLEDSSTTQLFVQGKNTTPKLQTFNPEAEERKNIKKNYRVIQQKVVVSNDGVSFKLRGVDDLVRLLGFSLIPQPNGEPTPEAKLIMNDLKLVGAFNSQTDLEQIITKLDLLKENSENEVFATYWKLQVQLLQEAEKFFYYRGWSERTKETGMGLFDHLFQSAILYDALLNYEAANESPLYERALWYNGRLLYWLWLERGTHREKDAAFYYLEKMLELHPDNKLVRMYNGFKIDTPDSFDNIKKPDNAPVWAFTQWEFSNRLKSIADWWVQEQQDENGEFGGKFGDDVEILRWWSPLILSGDEIAFQGWKKLANGVWNSSKVKNGYAKKPSDVEHSSEFISDTAPLMVLYNDDPVYAERLAYSSVYFQNLWTGYNDNGNRFFKSAWFSSSEIETEKPKNRDVSYNARAVKAVRYYSWKTNDINTKKALIEWADAWLHISNSTEKDKPLGLIPSSVEFPTEKINGDESNWYIANMYWDYFNWSGSTAILDQLLFTWTFTSDNKYLLPIIQHLELVYKYRADFSKTKNPYTPGSEGWAAYVLGNSSNFWNVVENWRLLTKNDTYDELILEHGSNFVKYRISGNEEYLIEAMQPYLETVRYNEAMLTSEAIHTDRVFIKEPRVREAGILQGMITGFGADESASPYIAVSWEKASRDIAFLVTNNDSTHLKVDLYSFSNNEEPLTMRTWQLSNGTYELMLKSGGDFKKQIVQIDQFGKRTEIRIPSQKLVQLEIKLLKK